MSGPPQTTQAAAQDAVTRMRRMWPAFRWGDHDDPHSAAREYGAALLQTDDPAAITAGTTNAIREVGGRFPPPVAELLDYVRAAIKRTPIVIPDNPPNRCPQCTAAGLDLEVIVDGNGWASCTDGLHRTTWKAA
ncbi:MAG: hypothetical protein AB7O78_01790 [Thermoleophilia bacterium]